MATVQFDPLFVIETYTHFFRVTRIQPQGRKFLELFAAKYVHKSFRQQTSYQNPWAKQKEPDDKYYAVVTKNGAEYRFHIGQFKPFEEYLKNSGYDRGFYKVIEKPAMFQPHSLKTKVDEKWQLRKRQPEVVEFILSQMTGDNNSRLVTLPTGYGKGLISLVAMNKRRHRVAYMLLPKYIEKTHDEIIEKTTVTKKDIMVVQGSDSLRGLIEMAKVGTYNCDYLLISMKTWMKFLDSYVQDPRTCVEDEYGCRPEELYELLGIGTVCIDEIHEHIHAVFRTFCFMNADLAIGLSATFLSRDQFIDMIQQMMFPREIRFEDVREPPYIKAYGISYAISADSMRHIRVSERGSTTYSQSAFEKSILKNKQLTHKWLQLVAEVFANGFMDQYKEGHKCIIFFRSVKMCETVKMFLKMRYPALDIRKYTEEDPYENVIDADVRVTTIQSAGTAIDIPGLMSTLVFDNINEAKANLQCLGRLRKPSEGTARYYAVYSDSISKHVAYQRSRVDLFLSMEKVACFREFHSRIGL